MQRLAQCLTQRLPNPLPNPRRGTLACCRLSLAATEYGGYANSGLRASVRTPINAELTTQEAAELPNVSRPYLIRLLDQKKIPFHMVGRHRRILFKDVMQYRQQSKRAKFEAMHRRISFRQCGRRTFMQNGFEIARSDMTLTSVYRGAASR